MKTIEVEIKGASLMMHNPKSMLEQQPSTRGTTVQAYYPKEAEKSAYRTSKGILYIPSQALFSSMLNGASFKKVGKYSAVSFLAGNCRIEPDEVSILDSKGKPITKYEID